MEEIKTGVFRINSNKPIYIIGDIHGDYQCLIHCLTDLCGVTYLNSIERDEKFNEPQREILEWIPDNDSVVVLCGDIIHRKRFQDNVLDDECSDIFMIETLFRLKKKAQKYSGDIIIISGNHEIMNIINPYNSMYTSDKNIESNLKYFSKSSSINEYISNTYAWIKINDILIAHGGICSDYLKFLDNENELKKKYTTKEEFSNKYINHKSNIEYKYMNPLKNTKNNYNKNIMIGGNIIEYGDNIVEFVNNKYKKFFTNYKKTKQETDPIGYKLFEAYDFKNKHNHNMFWCREWGYSGINCDNFNEIVNKVGCNKMIISHCPQFLSPDKPKMINFECVETNYIGNYDNNLKQKKKYKIARVDLGMSRSFDYNKSDEFISFLSNNYNRKISVLKLNWDTITSSYYFNYDCVITEKLSCIQYLLIKYGLKKEEWEQKNIKTEWLGFNYINQLEDKEKLAKCNNNEIPDDVILCLLYPLYFSKHPLSSVNQFTDFLLNKKNN